MSHVTHAIGAALVALLVSGSAAQAKMPGDGRTVQAIMPAGITGNVFEHDVAQIGLEMLGYRVKPPMEADYPALHLAIAQGEADYMATEWIPTHDAFFKQAGGDAVMVRIGKEVTGATQGYFIDKVTADKYKINNLGQLKSPEIAKLFDSDGDGKANLTGCNPGWGCERVIEHQLDAFKLRDTVQDDQGSYFALMADTITRFKAGQPILYYTWAPQWVGAVLQPGRDVVQLNVPFSASPDGKDTAQPDGSNPGFGVDTIVFLANKDFIAKNPAVKRLFELITIPIGDINQVILRQHDGETKPEQIMAQAREWVSHHQAQFDGWVKQAADSAP